MSISPINETRLQPDALGLDACAERTPAADQSSESPLSRPAIEGSPSLTDEEILAHDAWTAADTRTFNVQPNATDISHSMPTPEALDRIAADILSFLT